MVNPRDYRHRISKIYNNISFATLCNGFIAHLSAARPGKHSHHLFRFYNKLSIITLWVWILSGLSCLAVHLLISGLSSGIKQVDYLIIFCQVILNVVILWIMYMFLEWDCNAEMAKFIGCVNITPKKSWTERCEIDSGSVEIPKQASTSLAIALCDALGPATFYLSLYLMYYLTRHSPVPLSWTKITFCILMHFILWLYWAVLYFFSLRWIGGHILKYHIFKNHSNLKADGYNILWKVFVEKIPPEKI